MTITNNGNNSGYIVTSHSKFTTRGTDIKHSRRRKHAGSDQVNRRIKVSLMCAEHDCCCETKVRFKVQYVRNNKNYDLFCVYGILTCDTKGISVCSTERVLISRPESKLLLPHGDEAIPAELSLPAPDTQCTALLSSPRGFLLLFRRCKLV